MSEWSHEKWAEQCGLMSDQSWVIEYMFEKERVGLMEKKVEHCGLMNEWICVVKCGWS